MKSSIKFQRGKRGQASVVGVMFFLILFVTSSFTFLSLYNGFYEYSIAEHDMNQLEVERSAEKVEITSVGFDDYTPAGYFISSGIIVSGNIGSLQKTDKYYFSLHSGMWWNMNYQYRRQITITNTADSTLSSGYSVLLVADTTGPGFLDNGDDLRVVYWTGSDWVELDRINETPFNSTSTEIWFKTQESIPSSGSDSNYYMYYGNPSAGSPPANRSNIYLWFDDFEADTRSLYSIGRHATDWHGSGEFTNFLYDAANRRITYNTGDDYVGGLMPNINETDVYVEMKMGVTGYYPTHTTQGILVRWQSNTVFYGVKVCGGAYTPKMGIVENSRTDDLASNDTAYHPMDGSPFKVGVATWGNNIKMWYGDGTYPYQVWATATDTSITSTGKIDFLVAQSEGWLDDLTIRKYVEPEPSTSTDSQQTAPRCDWYGVFTINENPSAVDWMEVSYMGHYDTSVNQEVYMYNFTGSGWDGLGASTVSKTDIRVGPIPNPGNAQNYVNPANREVWVRVSSTSSEPYSCYADYLHLKVYPKTEYQYRSQINVKNDYGSTLSSGYSVSLTVDTASLVAEGKMLANGNDLRIFWWNSTTSGWEELDRDIIDMNTTSTRVWFKTQAGIAGGETDSNYYLYYGYPEATNPPSNKNNIYVFYDDFSANTLGNYNIGRWLSLHGSSGYATPTYDSLNKRVNFDTGDNIVTGFRQSITGTNLYAEMKVRWEASYPTDATVGIGIRWTATNSYYVGHVSYGSYTSPAIALNSRTNYLATPPTDTYFPKDGTWHKLAFAVWGNSLKLWLDDVEKLSTADSTITDEGEVVFEVAQIRGSVDDFFVRRYVEPEPSTFLGEEETVPAGYVTVEFMNAGTIDVKLDHLWVISDTDHMVVDSAATPTFGKYLSPGEMYTYTFQYPYSNLSTCTFRVVSERGNIWSCTATPNG